MIKKIKFLLFILLIFVSSLNVGVKANIKILYKINNEIITNIDIENEIKYLIALNNQLNKLEGEKIIAIAKDSIIREKIKEIEILKFYVLDQNSPYLNTVVEDFYKKLGMGTLEQFEKYLIPYNLTIEKLKKKIEIETTWNQLIYEKYKKQINIDMEVLEKSIDKDALSRSSKKYLLSEIIIEKNPNETFDDTILRVEKSIQEIGFKNTATTFSSSNSAKFGGNIGWIEEIKLSKKINEKVKNLKIGEKTSPILIGKNFLIIKLEDLKEDKIKIDKNEILKKLSFSESERQLLQFSNIYFNKVKINTYIDEL
jgi:peptidyl-prolyl cis-trans isomerase SurA